MAIIEFDERKRIIIEQPGKKRITAANAYRQKLMLHIHGVGMGEAIEHCSYHENPALYDQRKKYAVSNKDLFARLLGDEEQVFTARGGSAFYNLPKGEEDNMNATLSNVRYGMSLHRWMQDIALQAYRADPMGVIYVEKEQSSADGKQPKCYPTYKSSNDIWDYGTSGRKLEYLCLKITGKEIAAYGIVDNASNEPVTGLPLAATTNVNTPGNDLGSRPQYYRFIDDKEDIIYKLVDGNISEATMREGVKSVIPNEWNKVPGFIISDLFCFHDMQLFASPIDAIVELADSYLRDRSIRDLQKLYHGFAKAYEPAMECPTCAGEGLQKGQPCPTCTQPGDAKGSGFKIATKVGDVARFPLALLKEIPGFDAKLIFGYVTPDIESWNKQDLSLSELEHLMRSTYWNTSTTEVTGFNGSQDTGETATKTLTNLQPKYARLNTTADWAEGTEKMVANLMGEYYYPNTWKGASISYGRGYILETPTEIFDQYQKMVSGGSPDVMLNEQFEKYIKCLYQNNPLAQAKYLKLFEVEPFPHRKASDVEASPLIPLPDKMAKIYFGEWEDTLKEEYIMQQDVTKLRAELATYVTEKVKSVERQQQAEHDRAVSLKSKPMAA